MLPSELWPFFFLCWIMTAMKIPLKRANLLDVLAGAAFKPWVKCWKNVGERKIILMQHISALLMDKKSIYNRANSLSSKSHPSISILQVSTHQGSTLIVWCTHLYGVVVSQIVHCHFAPSCLILLLHFLRWTDSNDSQHNPRCYITKKPGRGATGWWSSNIVLEYFFLSTTHTWSTLLSFNGSWP